MNSIDTEINFLENNCRASAEIIQGLRERTRLREKLNSQEFALEVCRPILQSLKSLDLHLSKHVELFNKNMNKIFSWKNVDVMTVMKKKFNFFQLNNILPNSC
jgi:hypothetical protein